MKIEIKQWLAPPIFEGNEEKTRKASLLNAAAITGLVIILLVIFINLLDRETPARNFMIDLLFLTSLLYLRREVYKGQIEFVGLVIPIIGFILSTFVILSEGTILSPATSSYLLFVIIAGIVLGARALVIAIIVSSLSLLLLLLNLTPYSRPATISDWFVYTVLFGMTGSLVFFVIHNAQTTLTKANHEIEAREKMEIELRKLTRAVEQGPASIVITDLDGTIEYVNPRFTQITGYSFEEAIGKNPRILKTDRTPPETYKLLWETINAGREWRGEFINRKKDGSLYHESAIISPITDLNGVAVTHYLAIKEDITDRKRNEELLDQVNKQLHQQNEYLSILHQVTLDLLNHRNVDELLQLIVDRAVILMDAPYSELMLEKDGELIVQTFTQNQRSLKGDRVGRAEAKLSWSAFETKKPAVLDDYSSYPDRRDIYSETNLHAVVDLPVLVRGKCIGVLAMGRSQAGYVFSEAQIKNGMLFAQLVALVLDNAQLFSAAEYEISERKLAEVALQKANEQLHADMEKIEQLKEELREQAIRDPLTTLYNRRYLNETLIRELARVEREKNPLSVIISDIDHFKTINDTYGHSVGDKFLVEIASLMKKHARGSDIVCRYGGEEFLMVLPGISMDSAAKRAEEIRQKCAEVIIQHEGKDLKTTMSFGVATYPAHGNEAQEIIIHADNALYRSKHNGRNQVTVWSETLGE